MIKRLALDKCSFQYVATKKKKTAVISLKTEQTKQRLDKESKVTIRSLKTNCFKKKRLSYHAINHTAQKAYFSQSKTSAEYLYLYECCP